MMISCWCTPPCCHAKGRACTPSAIWSTWARHDQAVVEREDHGGRPVAKAELREHVADVGLDGALPEDQLVGDLAVAQSGPDQREHLALPRGEHVDLRSGAGGRRTVPVRREH